MMIALNQKNMIMMKTFLNEKNENELFSYTYYIEEEKIHNPHTQTNEKKL
jgi:hypothetical protein